MILTIGKDDSLLFEVIVGNVCSLCAMGSDSVSSTRKKNSQVLAVQILSQVFYGAGSIILKGYSSTVQNGVAILRNIAAIKRIKYKVIEWILIALGVGLGIVFNNRGLVGWLPIVANFEYSIAVFKFKDNEIGLKTAFALNAMMYCVFNAAIMNYVGAAANVVVIAATVFAVVKKARQNEDDKKEEKDNPEKPNGD